MTFIVEADGYPWAKNMKRLLQDTCVLFTQRKRKKVSARQYENLKKRYANILTRGEQELLPIPARHNDKRGRIAKSDARNLWDALIKRGGRVVGIVDAKYKRLTVTAWNTAPQREDLYQLSAYVTRYRQFNTPVRAMLAYPVDSVEGTRPHVERENPWYLDRDTSIYFLTLPHDIEEAVIKIRTLWPTHHV